MPASDDIQDGRWSGLSRSELIALGRRTVTERLEEIGARIAPGGETASGPLAVTTAGGREIEVFVSTQRLGGYAFWTKRRLHPSEDRFAAIVLLADDDDPEVLLMPTTDWLSAEPPLRDRDNIGKRSEAEWGISLAASWMPTLRRYSWDPATAKKLLA
jgi:hypothetical protein